jgi:hypothetical protein
VADADGGLYDPRHLNPQLVDELYQSGRRPGHGRALRSLSRNWHSWISARDRYLAIQRTPDCVQDYFTAGAAREVQQGKNMADAAFDAGVEHFVFSSVGGAERKSGIPHFETKWEIENHIRKLRLPATMFRPVGFMENYKSGFQADIPALRRDYPDVSLTSLEEWLRREGWQGKRQITVKRDSMGRPIPAA